MAAAAASSNGYIDDQKSRNVGERWMGEVEVEAVPYLFPIVAWVLA